MLALEWNGVEGGADLAYESGSLREGDELATAVFASLFCDAPARDVDPIPAGAPKSGWWGDAFEDENPGEVWGSRLWTLKRWPMSDAVIPVAIEMIEESLEWMVDDGIAESVTGVAEIYARKDNTLAIGAEIKRPGELAPTFVGFWNGVTGERL
jgi:phage gp46-like protein